MKKPKADEDDVRVDWAHARRGRYAKLGLRTARAVFLSPELYAQFGSDEAVREALETMVKVRGLIAPKPKRGRRAA